MYLLASRYRAEPSRSLLAAPETGVSRLRCDGLAENTMTHRLARTENKKKKRKKKKKSFFSPCLYCNRRNAIRDTKGF